MTRLLRHDPSVLRGEDEFNVSFNIYVFSVLVNSDMAELLVKRRWCKEEISKLCGSMLC